jgi:ribonuclease-3
VTPWITSSPGWRQAEALLPDDLAGELAERLGYRFADPSLLARALVHRSWVAEAAEEQSNERLEFLGDAVLGLVVTDFVYRTWPARPEGDLSRLRASVVSTTVLAEVAEDIDLGPVLRLGRGEDASGGRAKPSILADGVEAVIGAVYLDGGWEPTHRVVLGLLEERIRAVAGGTGAHDHKTLLQELVQSSGMPAPVYVVVDEGPDHAKRFYASVRVGARSFGGGEGRSKKQAEQAVARLAWEALRDA